MPFLNMFKSRRARSASLPRAPQRYLLDSEVDDQAPAYGPHFNSSFSRPVHLTSSRAPRNPSYGSSISNSGPERYTDSLTNDQSWYRVEHPDYYRGTHDRDSDYYSYSEGSRNGDGGAPVPAPVHTISDSSGIESPVPTVYRQGSPAQGSRMFERFASPPVPASVTRLDLHEGIEDGYDTGFDRHRRGAPVPAPTNARHLDSRAGRHRYQPPHRQPSQRTFQGPTHVHPTFPSDSSRSDVMQVLDDGNRVPIPRQPLERLRLGSQGPNSKRTYYIVPPGMSVIFRDEFGNELKRVGDFSEGSESDLYDEAPIELTDEHGRVVYKTGENFTDDGSSDVSEATYRPKVVHLGQYVPTGSAIPRSVSPLTVALDRRGYHKHIQLEHSEDGSFGGSLSSDRSFSPRPPLSHARSEGNLAAFGPGNHRSQPEQVRLRTVYP